MPQASDILQTIGNTPLVRLNRIAAGIASPIYAKLERFNPGGSVKDRVALGMIEAAEREGRLKPGATIIEATAGNPHEGLALTAAVKGYRLIVVLPDEICQDEVNRLRAYGAEVVITETNVPPDSPESYNGVADRLALEIPGAWRPNPFANPNNPLMHYLAMGPEIWRDTNGQVDVFVAGRETGGTLSGVARFLKEKKPSVTIVRADPEGPILSCDRPHSGKMAGIGEDLLPKPFDLQIVDERVRVSDEDSFHTARRLAREEGLLAGGSCGTAVAAALAFARRLNQPQTIVVLLPDTGRNYMSRLVDDERIREKSSQNEPRSANRTVRQVLDAKRFLPGLVAVGPRERIRRAIHLMQVYNISQLPVLEEGRCVGSLNESSVMKLLHDGIDCDRQEIAPVMSKPLASLDESTDAGEAYRRLLAGAPGLLVTHNGESVGVITRADLIASWLAEDRAPKPGGEEDVSL